MKTIIRWILVLLVLILFILPVMYFWQHFDDPIFRDNSFGNLFATMVGVIVGIPIALEINRRQQKAKDEKEENIRRQEEFIRMVKILKLINIELEFNLLALKQRQPDKEDGNRKVFANSLKEELWKAFSDGGELHYIDDPQLLDIIATAYYNIRIVIYLEKKYFEATHFPGIQIQQTKYPKDYILEYLTQLDSDALKSIDNAMTKITDTQMTLEQ